jgi:hypothetical protein
MRYIQFILLAIVLILGSAISSKSHAQNVKTYIPPKALPLIPIIKGELEDHFADIPQPWYVPALIEHESCISLKHSKCWSTTSRLHTRWDTGKDREIGAGLGQLTAAWRPNGDLRFDSLANLKKMYPIQLKDLTWSNINNSPDLQIRAIALLLKSDYQSFRMIPDSIERLKMTDSAYNGGSRDVHRARKICDLTKGCNPNIWFNHVEKHSVKSTKVLYGTRSPKDINNHHVRDVFLTRMPKYEKLLPKLDP